MGRKASDRPRKKDHREIKDWAHRLIPELNAHSLEKLSIDQLARWMQKSKSTIYEYFSSKEEIIIFAIEVHLELFKEVPQILRAHPFQPRKQYEQFMALMVRGTQVISPRFLYELPLYYPEAWKSLEAFLTSLLEEIRHFYEEGIRLEVFKPVSVELLICLDRLFVFQIINDPSLTSHTQTNLDALVEDYLRLKFEGLMQDAKA